MKWRLIIDSKLDPYYNMAVDESIMQSFAVMKQPVLRFYDWTANSVSIGYFQRTQEVISSIDVACPQIVRRPTGGGAVVHGEDITFSIVFAQKSIAGRVIDSYRKINESIIRKIKRNTGFSILNDSFLTEKQDSPRLCFTQPTKYDILWNNEKIGGSAQRRKNEVVLHQSSFYYKKCLPETDIPEPESRSLFVNYISEAVFDLFDASFEHDCLTECEKKLANDLFVHRYSQKEWNYLR